MGIGNGDEAREIGEEAIGNRLKPQIGEGAIDEER